MKFIFIMEPISMKELSKEIISLKKQMEELKESFSEDIKFAVRTELAWQEVDRGEVNSYSKDEFLKKLEEW